MNRFGLFAAMIAGTLASTSYAAVNYNLSDGSASFATAGAGVFGAPFDNATLPDTNLYADGASSFDFMSKYCWYYRVVDSNNGKTVPLSYAGQPVITGSANSQTGVWGTNTIASHQGVARFSAELSLNLSRAGVGKLNTTANMLITADPANSDVQVFEIFCLVDPSVSIGVNNGLADDAQLSIAGNNYKTTFSDGDGRYFEYVAKDATRYEVASSSTVKTRLSTNANNLNVLNTSIAATDAAAAYQWTLVLNPGESRLLETAFSANQPATSASVPEPGAIGLIMGMLALVRRSSQRPNSTTLPIR